MVIEFIRNVCGIKDAHSTEFEPAAENRVFFKLRELKGIEDLGGTMRLGSWPCKLQPGSLAHEAYGEVEVHERHRHRFEFNREFDRPLLDHGMRTSGETPDGMYVEICELPGHPWHLGCQFHPEFKSRPLEPHPLFVDFIRASYKYRQSRLSEDQLAEERQFLRTRVQ
jgi:CTP synthase